MTTKAKKKQKSDEPKVVSFACRFEDKIYEIRRDSLNFREESVFEIELGGVSMRMLELDMVQLFSARACPIWAYTAVSRERDDVSLDDFGDLSVDDIRVTVGDDVLFEGKAIEEALAEAGPTSTPEESGSQGSGRGSGSSRGSSTGQKKS